MKNPKNLKKPQNTLESQRKIERRAKRAYAVFACLVLSMAVMICWASASSSWACPSRATIPPSGPTVCSPSLAALSSPSPVRSSPLSPADEDSHKGRARPRSPHSFPAGGDVNGKRKLDRR